MTGRSPWAPDDHTTNENAAARKARIDEEAAGHGWDIERGDLDDAAEWDRRRR